MGAGSFIYILRPTAVNLGDLHLEKRLNVYGFMSGERDVHARPRTSRNDSRNPIK